MFKRSLMTALAFSSAAYAQEATAPPLSSPAPTAAETDGRIAYDAAYFAQYAPQTALDMVRQTPGFSLDGGDDRRGFSGAVGNLLIDGQRPIAKNQSLDTILSQIPAAQVVRIELLRGAAVAGDASGQSVLLNVVRTASAGSGVWEVGGEIASRQIVAPQGSASWSGRSGQTEYGVGAMYYSQFRDLDGGREIYDGAGVLTARRYDFMPRDYREGSLNANLAAPLLGGRFSATSQVYFSRYHGLATTLTETPAGVQTGDFLNNNTERELELELGLNYDRAFGPWSLSLAGLANQDTEEVVDVAVDRDGADNVVLLTNQNRETVNRETILRAALSRALTPQHRIEIGAEGAFNSLDASLAFTSDSGAGPTARVLPNSNVLVKEERAEAFGVHTWRMDERWTLESRLAWETSTLTFSGDANQAVELSFWKPSVQLARAFGEQNQVHVRYYRDVGQLDFGDFVSAASIDDGRIDGGNPDLAPQTAWRAELGADLRFPGGAALALTYTHHWVSDTADVMQVIAPGPNPGDPPVRFDAPGNIGDSQVDSLDANLTLPLGALLQGARLTLDASLWRAEVTDPVTGRTRLASNTSAVFYEAEFRQDLPALKLAWGVNVEQQSESQVYRFNEIDTVEEGPWVDLFLESTAIEGVKLRGVIANIASGDVRRQRRFFAPDRGGALDRIDIRHRNFAKGPWIVFVVSGAF